MYKIILHTTIVILASIFFVHNQELWLYIPYSILVLFLLQLFWSPKISIFLKFFVALFILGNWLKITIHGILDYPYVEATGSFTGTLVEWNRYFLFSITISASLLTSAWANYCAPRSSFSRLASTRKTIHSSLFTITSIFLILLIYALNWEFGFYRIGVSRTLNLPFGLDAPISFMVYLGAPILLALLATNSVITSGRVTIFSLFSISFISILAAMTTYSRAALFVLLLPIFLGMYKKSHQINGESQSFLGMFTVMVPTTVALLAAVSVMRISVYGGSGEINQTNLDLYLFESIGLFVDRWIGAEALMVSVSSHQSTELFIDMITENPSAGMNGIYQNLAGSQYLLLSLDNMTFLTLPGALALLTFSGSYSLVFFGVFIICIFGIIVEQAVIKLFAKEYALQYLISAALAYHFSQMIFAKLLIPFIVQLFFFLALLKLYYKIANNRIAH